MVLEKFSTAGNGPVTDHRGQTTVPVKWNVVREQNGTRYIEGIAYNAAIEGERRRVTCSDKVWNDPDQEVFYNDESVRWTVDELKELDLHGVPMRVQHRPDMPPVGTILHNYLDSKNRLRIVAEVPAGRENAYGNAIASLIDNDSCSELSIGYPLERNPVTHEVRHMGVDEVSFVTDGHFRGCRVNVKASRGQPDRRAGRRTEFRAVRKEEKAKKVRPFKRTPASARVSTVELAR